MPYSERSDNLRRKATELLLRLTQGRATSEDLIEIENAVVDGDPKWVPGMIAGRILHEPDFALFGKFQKDMGTVLDIGANWGYSVGSMRAAGCDCPVLSFEVLSAFEPCLKAVREYLRSDYDYVMVGLGDRPDQVEFLIPTVGKNCLTALTTAQWRGMPASTIDGIVSNMVNYADAYLKDAKDLEPHVVKVLAKIETLDNILASYRGDVPLVKISAIKIDVEGFEAEVLSGGRQTISKYLPMLMLEGGNRLASVANILQGLDYKVAEFANGQLDLSQGTSKQTNGYFVHASKIEEYRGTGLLR